jgi:hypothetical protein
MIHQTEAGAMLDRINAIRTQILNRIQEYTRMNALMTNFENHYLALVLLPSYHLQQAIQTANYLEAEYSRISSAIQSGFIAGPEEVEAEVSHALHHADFICGSLPRDLPNGLLQIVDLLRVEDQQDFVLTASQQEKTLKEFKRLVMPRVHADTSDAPFEVFQLVFDAYKKRDFLMLAAFVIEYRGELPSPNEDLSAFQDLMPLYLEEYGAVFNGLEKRLHRLKQDPTSSRLENADQILRQLKEQNVELRKAAIREAERVLLMRNCLEELMQRKKFDQKVN